MTMIIDSFHKNSSSALVVGGYDEERTELVAVLAAPEDFTSQVLITRESDHQKVDHNLFLLGNRIALHLDNPRLSNSDLFVFTEIQNYSSPQLDALFTAMMRVSTITSMSIIATASSLPTHSIFSFPDQVARLRTVVVLADSDDTFDPELLRILELKTTVTDLDNALATDSDVIMATSPQSYTPMSA